MIICRPHGIHVTIMDQDTQREIEQQNVAVEAFVIEMKTWLREKLMKEYRGWNAFENYDLDHVDDSPVITSEE